MLSQVGDAADGGGDNGDSHVCCFSNVLQTMALSTISCRCSPPQVRNSLLFGSSCLRAPAPAAASFIVTIIIIVTAASGWPGENRFHADHPTVELLISLCTFTTFPAIAHRILDKVLNIASRIHPRLLSAARVHTYYVNVTHCEGKRGARRPQTSVRRGVGIHGEGQPGFPPFSFEV
jgi:hypothetical protein